MRQDKSGSLLLLKIVGSFLYQRHPEKFVFHRRGPFGSGLTQFMEGVYRIDLSDGNVFTTMEWLMVFVKVPFQSMVFQCFFLHVNHWCRWFFNGFSDFNHWYQWFFQCFFFPIQPIQSLDLNDGSLPLTPMVHMKKTIGKPSTPMVHM